MNFSADQGIVDMETIGWSVLNNYDKFFDLQVGLFIFVIFAFMNFVLLIRPVGLSDVSDLKNKNIDYGILGVSFLVAFKSFFPSVPNSFIIISVFIVYIAYANQFLNYNYPKLRLDLCFAVLGIALVLLLVLSRPNPILTSLVLIPAMYVGMTCGPRSFVVFALFLLLRFDAISIIVISDTFHSSEKFTSVLGVGSSIVFPNIGYAEQLPAKLLYWINEYFSFSFNLHSFSQFLVFICVSFIFKCLTIKRGLFVGTLFLILVPLDRFGPVLALALAFFLQYEIKNNSYGLAVIYAITPALMLIFSPVDAALFLLIAIIAFHRVTTLEKLPLLFGSALFVVLCLFFGDDIVNYINIYRSFGSVNVIAHGLPLFNLPDYEVLLKLVLIGCIGILASYFVYFIWSDQKYNSFILKIFLTLAILILFYVVTSYALTRVDPGASRIVNRCVLLMFVTICVFDIQKFVLIMISVCSFFLLSPFHNTFSVAQPIGNYIYNSNIFDLSSEKAELVGSINRFERSYSVDVILFSDPALSYWLGAKLPPFTTPWVTVGGLAQEENIEFFRKNASSAIYLGSSWITYDGVDIRKRSPLLFDFLGKNYQLIHFDGGLYYLPN